MFSLFVICRSTQGQICNEMLIIRDVIGRLQTQIKHFRADESRVDFFYRVWSEGF